MIHLNTQEEKDLWRDAAKNAIAAVDAKASEKDAEKVLSFVHIVADGVVLAYRRRCHHEER